MHTIMLSTAAASVLCAAAAPALAATTIYTSEAAFDAAFSGLSTYTVPDMGDAVSAEPSQILDGITFTSNTLFYFDQGYGTPFIGDFNYSGGGTIFTISSSGPALGVFLGSYYGAETYSYDANGIYRSVALPAPTATTFFGLGNPGGSVSLSFAVPQGSEVDVTGFISGTVPEPKVWALMLAGLGGVGALMRRRSRLASA